MPNFLAAELIKHKLSSYNSDENLVFCREDGSPQTSRELYYHHNKNCKVAAIRPVVFHALRHTFATRMIENGIDVKTVSEMLGHKDVMITLNTYTHSTLDNKIASAAMMDNLHKSIMV